MDGLTNSQIEQFHKNGFLVVSSVLTNEQVRELREFLLKLFESGIQRQSDDGCIDICARYPELRWLLIHPPIVSALRSLLGNDFVYLPEMAAHDSCFGGWHKDTGSQEKAGHKFHYQPDYLMVQAALYLQDNGKYGGGLDVIPGSHLHPDKYITKNSRQSGWLSLSKLKRKLYRQLAKIQFVRTIKGKLNKLRSQKHLESNNLESFVSHIPLKPEVPSQVGEYSIPSKAGDLVLFDFRLDHKASWPEVVPIPLENRKLVFFFACSKNNENVAKYKKFLLSREVGYEYLKGHRYPKDLLELARKHGITLA
ncbi:MULTISPECIES: phytanoyl-CoA dioxygenase family protein [Cyanophyceae]|uniref:phytanoyl-CoA dioxygenase family protein n=1 Tax=Cyanophyceae TaxID=3028117 RepID=UPI0016837683|nr:phytanoyl-CoA dioxygenase family protein [Trichocoleus sp. FACHB-40]MBD2002374.1 phytanoyl-CoA dioxygenase family protein [Trichocoleus sp. FACHB-40]